MPQSLPKAGSLNVPQALAQALERHQQGRLAEAERLYAAILAVRPDNIDALQMMGLVKLALGQPAEALRLVSAAMRARTPSPQILLNHGLVLNALKRHQEAIESFDKAIKLKSKYAEAHNNRGAALVSLGRNDEALESLRKAVAIKPDYAEAHYNIGTSLRALGRTDEALKSFDRALALQPKYFKAHNNRGAVLEAQNRLPEALASYERALALNPGFTEARNNRIHVLGALNRYDEALASLDQALALKPDDAEAYYERGKINIDLNRNDDATADFEKALAIRPNLAEARIGSCMAELPIMYADEGEIVRRRAAYAQKLRALCDDVDAGRLTGDLVKALATKHPFLLSYQGYNDRDLQNLYGAMVCRIVQRQFPAAELPPPPAAGEPVRIGIVSGFFYLHSNWKIPIKGWLSQLDRKRFKLFGYHVGTRRDAETDVAAAMCDRFVHRAFDVDGWRREILADAPHVLIYPGLLMDNLSLPLAAQRLAPVQCTSWGHPETSGMPTLDYFFSSDGMEPPDASAHYTEQLVRLPNLSIYYEPVATEPVAVSRAELGLRADAAVFWCGQSLYKYLPQFDSVFARIAREAAHCQFVFLRHSGGPLVNELFEARLQRAFAALGLKASDHCVFLGRLSQSKFVAAIGQCDVFLDSIGWSGCNSALENLPHGLPIVTTPGALMRGRHSAAILRMMGVTDTIADTIDDYVAIAARLANNPAQRQALRARMQEAEPKVYRDRSCISALEDFLEHAARRSGEASGISVSPSAL
ncbi:MAG: tetratricopeptide repeat protein [Rhizobiales bacterium]|nr:tetratricopeptide repeat protein [Hyphomicrobiales bacterium]